MPQKYPIRPTEREALQEFVSVIEAAYDLGGASPLRLVAENRQVDTQAGRDLSQTYRKAKEVLSRFPMPIKRFLRQGALEGESVIDTDELLELAGNYLDGCSAHEILGEALFEGEDGAIYVLTVEAVLAPANPDYVQEVEAELLEENASRREEE